MNSNASVSGLRRAQEGQALTEFLVACLALVPLFVLVPMIGKYQDVSHNTLMASRYVAFEATNRYPGVNSWKPEAQLASEVRRRFFSNSEAPIKYDDASGDFSANRNLMWSDGFGNPLIAQISRDVVVTFGPARSAAHANAFSSSSDGDPFWRPDRFQLGRNGIYTANISVAMANLPNGLRFVGQFNDLNLVITRSSSLIIDPWFSSSPADAQQHLTNTAINPGRTLSTLSALVDPAVLALDGRLVGLGSIRGPRLGQLDYWQDVVPADRLR